MNLRSYPYLISVIGLIGCLYLPIGDLAHGHTQPASTKKDSSFPQDAQRIKATYEPVLFTLTPYTFSHYGLRMYRQHQDTKYALSLWVDMARVANTLSKLSNQVYTPEQIRQYSLQKLDHLKAQSGERSERRYQATQAHPDYTYLLNLLSAMARADEFGLKHQQDAKLREIIRRYDFSVYATDPEMIKAWAAQLANNVYWLRQLGEQDVVAQFTEAFRLAYPDEKDHLLSAQQFDNKIYGLSHIIFADSQYYLSPVKESNHQWIYDYYRNNIDLILKHCKEDVIAEVGINFLLAQLDNDPVVLKTQAAISMAINREHNMVPSAEGDMSLEKGEHRNVLAIMLLDWQSRFLADKPLHTALNVVVPLPYGLERK